MLSPDTVQAFFDRAAPHWDQWTQRRESVIAALLENAGVGPGQDILDVACGTGVLFPDYLARGVASLTAIDLSPEMVLRARAKFPQKEVTVLQGNILDFETHRQFDVIMIYDAFPHLPQPERLIPRLAALLKPGGRLAVSHGCSREELDRHHAAEAHGVSAKLLHEEELAALMAPWLTVTTKISDQEMYQVVGRKDGR